MFNFFLLTVFLLVLLYYVIFLTGILRGLNKLKPCPANNIVNEYVSVIIPFRNESENILNSLYSLESQTYPENKFEVIYVNDLSDDDSLEKLNSAKKNVNIRVITIPPNYSPNAHKKRAIRYGIENSKGSIIVTTDADCVHNNNWLTNILGCFDENTGFVSGPVEFFDDDKLFGKIQKTEFAGLVLAGAGLIGINKPTICNAANIAYRKDAYEKVGGFTNQFNLSSGDDELLMQKIAKQNSFKVKFCTSRESIVRTPSNKSINQFYQQRKRWASKGLFYADKLLILKLILIYLFYLGLAAQLFLAIFDNHFFIFTFIFSFFLKATFEYMVLMKGSKMFFSKKILSTFLLAELLQIPYIIIAGLSGIRGNFTWKERKISR